VSAGSAARSDASGVVSTIVIAPTSWTIMLAATMTVASPSRAERSPSDARSGGVVWPT
jgi:hypothetical protein